MHTDPNIIWSLLLFTGYVTYTHHEVKDGKHICSLTIPNTEIAILYNDLIKGIFTEALSQPKVGPFIQSMLTGDVATFTELFQEFVLNSMSTFDIDDAEPEKSYHLFVLGLLVILHDTYRVKSNDPSGYGRYDIMLIPKDPNKPGVIIEFKKATGKNDANIESAATAALKQIEEMKYAQELRAQEIKHIVAYGIAFKGKRVAIKMHIYNAI
jgi:hypothetical protein